VGAVSCTVSGWLSDLLDEVGHATEHWLQGLDLDAGALRDPDQEIPWSLFATLCERLETEFGSRKALLAATRRCASARFSREAARLKGGFSDQRQLYWIAHRWLRPELFPALESSYQELDDGQLKLVLASPADEPACPLLFEMIRSALMNAPLLVDQPAARVDAELSERRAVYTIAPSSRAEAGPRDRYQAIAGSSGRLVYDWDAKTGSIEFRGDGEPLGFLPNRSGTDLPDYLVDVSPEDRRRFSAELERATAAKDHFHIEYSTHRPGRQEVVVENDGYFILDDEGEIRRLVGFARDITERRKRENERRDYLDLLDRIASASPEILYVFDLEASRVRFINDAVEVALGYPREEILCGGVEFFRELLHPDDHASYADYRTHVNSLNDGGIVEVDFRLRHSDGEWRWLRFRIRVLSRDAEGGIREVLGTANDITEQKTAESERALTEERFQAITQSSRDIIVEFDQTGNTLYVSPNVVDLIGYPASEIVSSRRIDLVHPSDARILIERLAKMMHTGESEDLIFRMHDRKGEWRWMDTTVTAFQTASGEIRAVMISRDITDRLEMEEERRHLVSIVENSSEFVAMIAADGRALFLNEAGQKLVGISGELQARSMTIFDCLAPEDSQDMRFHILPAAQRSGHWEGDFRLRHFGTGERITTLAHAFLLTLGQSDREPIVAIVARDISERITAERLLRESEARHRMLVESAYDLIAEIDLSGRYAYVNPNFDRQLGYAPEQLLGASWYDQMHPEDRARARDAIGSLSPNETRECPPLRLRRVDGSWLWAETNLKKYENFRGEPLVLAFFRDITRRKEAEDALRQSQEELLQSQKMEAIGRLAGGVAHDFNNLLTAITGYADLLLDEIGEADGMRADAEEILRAAERAADLTRQLLAFSRRQVLLPRVLDLNALVADVERLLRRLIGEDIELVTLLEGNLPHVKLDPGQLEQLVINLAVNARDAMPRGGRLQISTANLEIPPNGDPNHPGIRPGRYITFSVRDTGVGIEPEALSKIFEPFFTTKESGQGTGLGLATVYGIIQQSGGEIRVESEPGEGSTFTVYLPQVEEDLDPPEAATVVGGLRGDETVLLVEDSETVRKLVKRSLENHGYTVIDAPSGIDGLRRARRHEADLHVLVTDVVLPGMNGPELARRLNETRPGTKVVFISGFSDDALSQHGIVASHIALVQKPFAPSVLLRELRRVLGDPTPPALEVPAAATETSGEDR
jgi:PAS domain S-box-containing protein